MKWVRTVFYTISHKVPIVIIPLLCSALLSDVEVSCPWRIFSNHHTLLLSPISVVFRILSRAWWLSSGRGARPPHISLPLGDSLLDGKLLLYITARGHFTTVRTSEIISQFCEKVESRGDRKQMTLGWPDHSCGSQILSHDIVARIKDENYSV